MHPMPTLPRPHGATLVVAVALSTVIATGILASVVELFQSRGEPLGELAAAERACGAKAYISDREVCMHEWIAALHGVRVAGK
jgi:hypothetical protein